MSLYWALIRVAAGALVNLRFLPGSFKAKVSSGLTAFRSALDIWAFTVHDGWEYACAGKFIWNKAIELFMVQYYFTDILSSSILSAPPFPWSLARQPSVQLHYRPLTNCGLRSGRGRGWVKLAGLRDLGLHRF